MGEEERMKLNELSIKNFRGYDDAIIDFDDEINVVIGRNDVGKSTILDALEIFSTEKIGIHR